SGISALCCFRCTRSKELALVPCYRNRRPWIHMGSLALQELGLYPGLVRSCLHARGLSAGCLCGRACPRVQRGVAHSEGQLRRSRAHDSSVFVWLIGSFICRFLTVCLNAKSGEERVVYKRLNST